MFDLKDVGATAGVFNPEKMAWVNHEWLKKLPEEELARRGAPVLPRRGAPGRGRREAPPRRAGRPRAGEDLRRVRRSSSATSSRRSSSTRRRRRSSSRRTRGRSSRRSATAIAALPAMDTEPLEKLFQAEARAARARARQDGAAGRGSRSPAAPRRPACTTSSRSSGRKRRSGGSTRRSGSPPEGAVQNSPPVAQGERSAAHRCVAPPSHAYGHARSSRLALLASRSPGSVREF